MSRNTQDIITVIITVVVVSVIAYLVGFPMMFAHALVEVSIMLSYLAYLQFLY